MDFCESKGITKEEGVAIALFTSDNNDPDKSIRHVINRAISAQYKKEDCKYYVLHLLKALRKLPKYNNTNKVLYKVQVGGVYLENYRLRTKVPQSTLMLVSPSIDVALALAKTLRSPDKSPSAIFEISGDPIGYDITKLTLHQGKQEVLLEPGAQYEVTDVRPNSFAPGIHRIKLKTIQDSVSILDKAVKNFATAEKEIKKRLQNEAEQAPDVARILLKLGEVNKEELVMWDNTEMKSLLERPGTIADTLERELRLGRYIWSPDLFERLKSQTTKWAPLVAAFTRKVAIPFYLMQELQEIAKSQQRDKSQYPSSANGIWFTTDAFQAECGANGNLNCVHLCYNQLVQSGATSVVEKVPDLGEVKPSYQYTTVHVLSAEAMSNILSIHRLNLPAKIACLNPGGQSNPGGTWDMPAEPSLEENLFMCTTLSSFLGKCLYPIKSTSVIYTKDVLFFRDGVNSNYKFLDPGSYFFADVFTVVAYNLVRNGVQSAFTDELILKTHARLNVAFALAAKSECEILVLNDFGCGRFGNPPDVIAKIFSSLIMTYACYFKNVYFAIQDPEVAKVFSKVITDQEMDNPDCETVARYERLMNSAFSPVNSASVCPLGGACHAICDVSHAKNFSHPPPCVYGDSCTSFDRIHRLLFSHSFKLNFD